MRRSLYILKDALERRLKQTQQAAPDLNTSCILFHAINGIGLGHLSRLTAIALGIRERSPSTRLLFAVEGDSHGFLEAADLPHIVFPSRSKIFSDRWHSWPKPQREKLIRSMAESIVAAISPNLIVFDCFPNPLLQMVAHQKKIPFAICVRKSKDMDNYFKVLRPILLEANVIIFPHNISELTIPIEFADKAHFVGPVARPFPKADDNSNPHEGLILISGGGGGYPGTVNFYNLALEAFANCQRRDPRLSGLLVTGPLFREWRQLRLVPGVRITPFDPRITTAFRRAHLVICQAGYNTVAEVISSGVPAICVPAERKFDDQYERAKTMAGTHPQFHLWEDNDSEALSVFMLRLLQMPRTTHNSIDSQGSILAAEILIESMMRN
jgi:UDP-N-acetylglucosamine--N-acetylmuramyl-(pentapeptide) pyrophosphoryl-undecaprenol N-acetylglucosamine transferase